MDKLIRYDQAILEEILTQSRWTRRAVARLLRINKDTVKPYCELAELIPDFYKRVRKDALRQPMSGYQLEPYQVWVVFQVLKLMAELNNNSRGCNNYQEARYVLITDAAARSLSFEEFRYQVNILSAA